MKHLISIYLFLLIFRPYEYWPQLGSLYIQKVFMILLLICAFVYRDKRFRMDTLHLWLFVLVLSLLLSTATAWDVPLAWEMTVKYLKVMVFYLVLVMTVHGQERLEYVAKAMLVVTMIYVGKSAWEFFVHGRYVWRMGIARMIGIDQTYAMPNAFAATICYSLPLLWAVLGKGLTKRWMRLAMLGYGVLAPICIVMTGSRSGMVTALLFVAMISWRAKRKIGVAVLSVAILLVGWQFVPEMQQRRFMSIFNPEVGPAAEWAEQSAEGRLQGLLHGLELFTQHPVSGVGPNNTRRTWYGGDGPQAHNLVGQVIGELGGVGFVAFFGFIAAIFLRLRATVRLADKRLAKEPDPPLERTLVFNRRLALAGQMIIVLMLFNGLFGHNMFRYNWLFVAFFALASSEVVRGEASQGAGERESERFCGEDMEYARCRA
ncbi:O-antigen ligase family protein [Desulfohalovibrio reitneri]|uniref:O-antigen ligase family protein n=1 Tax=Desulfohalovibrio reitneri TaxID=1307759 RepID=UPI0004A6EEE4|nr:O-antigen ligase family protein [Desulfohalovibrio reitneri]